MSVTWLGLMLLSPLVILLEETALCLTDSRYCLFNLYFINFCFNIYYLLTVPALHFCFFSKNLRCLIRLFIWDFSGVWMWPHVSFPLTTALILSRRFQEVVSLLFDCRNVFYFFCDVINDHLLIEMYVILLTSIGVLSEVNLAVYS